MGKVFIVGDSGTVGLDRLRELFKMDPDGELRYFDDLEEALNSGSIVAGRGDVVLLAPGHAETISGATSILFDIADVTIIGLGTGTSRVTFTYGTATTASIPVSADNITLIGVDIVADFADIVAPFTTGAKNFRLIGCEVKDSAVNKNFLYVFDTGTTDNQSDGLSFIDSRWVTPDLATVSVAKVDGDLNRLTVRNSYVNLGVNASNVPALATVATGKDLTNVSILDNVVIRLNTANPLLVTADTTTANSGIVGRNYVRHADTAGELLVTAGTNILFVDNKASAVVDASGYTLPAVDS